MEVGAFPVAGAVWMQVRSIFALQRLARIELPDLIQAHDKLLAENLELHKENEAREDAGCRSPSS